ncbi:hypothetical protein AB0G04_23760 [Actinoplanes sp. NPDC023801]|uniref:hypothetical protein n=1 Tax=Actinoplanes sp. NPDC023801 TaxID=3154595 RepID=UPI0033CBC36E
MRLLPVLISSAVAGSLVSAAPARAAVTFDFHTNTGYVDAEDLLLGLKWDGAKLSKKSAKIEFEHNTHIVETWSVTCDDDRPFDATRSAQAMTEFLTAAATYRAGGTEIAGFRITGSDSAISATTMNFLPGAPCPHDGHGKTVRESRLLAVTTTERLIAELGRTYASLAELRTGPEVGA